MRSLKSLIEKHSKVWFYCGTEDLKKRFLEQAEEEGFITMRGEKPSSLSFQRLYGINDKGTMGYIPNFLWFLSLQTGSNEILHVDYDRFISGEEDYISQGPHMKPVSCEIQRI
ncbi:MAG: hypothetical protein IKH92_07245 [Clostridiales bacterium]|nr:hypothetical protein [Clostridiales bacterium]